MASNPKEHPLDIKADLVRFQVESDRAADIPVDATAIERAWQESLERVARKGPGKKKAPVSYTKKHLEALDSIDLRNRKALDTAQQFENEKRFRDGVITNKEKRMGHRISTLMQMHKDPSTGKYVATFPKEQRDIVVIWVRMQRGFGEFKGKSYTDKSRIVGALMEDICDKSVRWLGAWH